MNAVVEDVQSNSTEALADVIPLTQFISDFGDDLLNAVSRQNPPVYDGLPNVHREAVMEGLLRFAGLSVEIHGRLPYTFAIYYLYGDHDGNRHGIHQ